MTRPYSLAFKQKMLDRLMGKDALNPSQLARETGLRQQSLARWLLEARSLPLVGADKRIERKWTVEQKAQIVVEGCKLLGDRGNEFHDWDQRLYIMLHGLYRCRHRRLGALATRFVGKKSLVILHCLPAARRVLLRRA